MISHSGNMRYLCNWLKNDLEACIALRCNLSGSSSSMQDSLVGLASILIVPPYTLPSRKTKGLLDSGDKFSREEKRN